MNIGLAAEASGLPPKTIRYYEEIGLVRSDRRGNNYRDYSDKALHNLRFLARARALGFSIEECRQLLSLYADKDRASADVRGLAKAHMKEIDAKIRELQAMKGTLSKLVQACHGDERPD
ncbi:MAG: MerR family DNA-binding protein, partial [Rhizobiales bacterium]|nr:MerR family DNA-binding protein [Hyphomicrobiales bacterium]